LAALCVSAVTFLLRVLVALVKEWVGLPPRTTKLYLAKFNPPRRRGELIVMNPELGKREFPAGTDERIAL